MGEVELEAWLTLNRVVMRTRGMTPEFTAELRESLAKAGSARALLDMCRGRNLEGVVPGRLASQLRGFSQQGEVEKEAALVEESGVSLITILDKDYPPRLAGIPAAPLLLYGAGRIESPSGSSIFDERLPAVAVVGTRRASHYGLEMAEAIGRGLASSGIVVVSGMARGCDTAAHRGALSAGGLTIAVLGTGVDTVYPAENKKLYGKIKDSGVVLSEYPMGTAPLPMNFPLRNRIISGLSLAVVVVEAPLRSGAMMTARMALEQGREVFALPGHAASRKGSGTNKLIKDGAVLVESAGDIIEALTAETTCAGAGEKAEKKRGSAKVDSREQLPLISEQQLSGQRPSVQPSRSVGRPLPPADGAQAGAAAAAADEDIVIGLLDDGPMHIDGIVEKSGIAVQRLSGLLLDMELKGVVAQRPGKLFIKKI
ncbi:Rossmann fold nucleotide-binding protein Smf possibly involved in DNA uptake [hydrothermal vent metagenome]|uniref:Rossmann fold nucleotide-binding protein Smf possibly involved in DNA uptake n=1 Tax=hydrothermal vent metagenome TaxID=652676 RepID=A0A3B0VD20_9ZZZZ